MIIKQIYKLIIIIYYIHPYMEIILRFVMFIFFKLFHTDINQIIINNVIFNFQTISNNRLTSIILITIYRRREISQYNIIYTKRVFR
jgi:hypothetical protein